MYIKFTYREVFRYGNAVVETETTAQALFAKLAQLSAMASLPEDEALKPGTHFFTFQNVSHFYTVDVFIDGGEEAEMFFTLVTEAHAEKDAAAEAQD